MRSSPVRDFARAVAQQTMGRMPRGSGRLGAPLAANGGTPVRNLRYRPWPRSQPASVARWLTSVGPELRRIFLSGVEGLPQTRQKQFAAQWARRCGCRHGLMVPHGTDALRIALAAVFDHDGLAYGGEIIVPNLSFIATATAALDRRFGVAFVDVDAGTLNIDPARVEAAIVPGKTRAIMPVHQFGQPADMTALQRIARTHGLKIIEDAAQAHGAEWESGPAGSLGDAAAFSFQSAKNLSCGEGGVLTTNDDAYFERAFSIHNAGRSRELEARWEHVALGWNIRATEYQAALLLDRLGDFDNLQRVRAANFSRLRDQLKDVNCVQPLQVHAGVKRHGMYMFVMRYAAAVCNGLPIDRFIRDVSAEGIPLTRCYASTLSAQVAIQDLLKRRPEYVRVLPTPVSDRAAEEIVYLPANVFLAGASDIDDITAALRKVQDHHARQSAAPS
jgi:dTDP-4-amino-4,6-dideoxygalactose transaminase